MNDNKFTLRELRPSDSPELVRLISAFEGDMVTQFLVDAYTALIFGTEYQTLGMGVECAGVDGLVGLGTVRFSQVQFNGETLPLAFLDGLKVHKDYRGQGLGYRIAEWRIQRSREALGEGCLIATGLLRSNDASRRVARKWCREFIDLAYQPHIRPARAKAPHLLAGVEVRTLAEGDYAEFSHKQNNYFQDYNFYPQSSPQSISSALEVSAEDKKPYRFYTAVDSRGSLLAGAQIWLRGLIKSDLFSDPPPPLRLMNRLLHVLPKDFIIRDASVIGLWHEPGQLKAAQFLWETLRWELRNEASTLVIALDPRDPLSEVVGPRPLFIPHIEITVALHGPAPVDHQKLLFGYGRL